MNTVDLKMDWNGLRYTCDGTWRYEQAKVRLADERRMLVAWRLLHRTCLVVLCVLLPLLMSTGMPWPVGLAWATLALMVGAHAAGTADAVAHLKGVVTEFELTTAMGLAPARPSGGQLSPEMINAVRSELINCRCTVHPMEHAR